MGSKKFWKCTVEPMDCNLGRRETIGTVRLTSSGEQPVGIFDVCDVRRWDCMPLLQQRWALMVIKWLNDEKNFKVHCFKSFGQWSLVN